MSMGGKTIIPRYIFCEQPSCRPKHIVLFEMVGSAAVYEKRGVRLEIFGPFRTTCPACDDKRMHLVSETAGVYVAGDGK